MTPFEEIEAALLVAKNKTLVEYKGDFIETAEHRQIKKALATLREYKDKVDLDELKEAVEDECGVGMKFWVFKYYLAAQAHLEFFGGNE